jgi:predicted RNase H-like nuclease
MRFLGIDLAWGEGSAEKPANRSGVVALAADGAIDDAGWTIGLDQTIAWAQTWADDDTILFVDAPLVITNLNGQRLADKQVGQRYGRWWVSVNSVNTRSARQAGVRLRDRLEALGWRYSDGREGPAQGGKVVSECYPYTAIVGAEELEYDDKRPAYKRGKKGMPAAQAWPIRVAACDELIRRLARLRTADPPMTLRSHAETRRLYEESSPSTPMAYKKREDLLDAAICAWTAAFWRRYGFARCQVLGVPPDPTSDFLGTIIAPTRESQRPKTTA